MDEQYFYQVLQLMEHQWNEIDRGKPTTRRKTCPNATLSTTNLTWTWPGIEPGPPWWEAGEPWHGHKPTDTGTSRQARQTNERSNPLLAFWGLSNTYILFLDCPEMVNFQKITWTMVSVDRDWVLLLATPLWFARKIWRRQAVYV
jgi:hypothetical protein